MEELRSLWCLLDTNNLNLRARYVKSAANVWADKLSRHLDNNDFRLYPVLFAELDMRFGQHSIPTASPRYSTPYYRATTQGGRTQRAKRWTHSTSQTTTDSKRTTGATIPRPSTQPRPKPTIKRRIGYHSRPKLDMESLAQSAYLDGFRRNYRRSPSGPTRASGATRYNRQSSPLTIFRVPFQHAST
jgi:hypothetical protein